MSRTTRTGPELRDEAKRALSRRLAHEAHLDKPTPPEALAAELLVILDSHQIRLADGRLPEPSTGRPVTDLPADNPYHAARQALKGQQQ